MMQVNLDAGGAVSPRLNPMAEQSGAITVQRQALDLFNESGWFPFYLWRYTDDDRADRFVTPGRSFDEVPTPIELGDAIDHGLPLTGVVVYGRAAAPASVLTEPAVRTSTASGTTLPACAANAERRVMAARTASRRRC